MKAGGGEFAALLVLFFLAVALEMAAGQGDYKVCPAKGPCSHRRIRCPPQCPHISPRRPGDKYCEIDCNSPKCQASCNSGGDSKICPAKSPCSHKPIRCPRECPHISPGKPGSKYCEIDCASPKCEAYCKSSGGDSKVCPAKSPCSHKTIWCPRECPHISPGKPGSKYCEIDCTSPKCEACCKKHDCDKGSGCQDPRFIGGDGVVFYFHGRKDEHFTLVSDPRFQINARFIGLRPAGRTRDFTWIQALGFMFGAHLFTVEATKAERWDDAVDHLLFSYNGESLELPGGHRSSWSSANNELTVERRGRTNNVRVKLEGMVEASINVVPVTQEDDRIHKYEIPLDDCFAHLDVQFSFFGLSPVVEGVLGRTYQLDYVNPAKPGVAMPVLGGEDKYGTPSLLSPQCRACVFTALNTEKSMVLQVP